RTLAPPGTAGGWVGGREGVDAHQVGRHRVVLDVVLAIARLDGRLSEGVGEQPPAYALGQAGVPAGRLAQLLGAAGLALRRGEGGRPRWANAGSCVPRPVPPWRGGAGLRGCGRGRRWPATARRPAATRPAGYRPRPGSLWAAGAGARRRRGCRRRRTWPPAP